MNHILLCLVQLFGSSVSGQNSIGSIEVYALPYNASYPLGIGMLDVIYMADANFVYCQDLVECDSILFRLDSVHHDSMDCISCSGFRLVCIIDRMYSTDTIAFSQEGIMSINRVNFSTDNQLQCLMVKYIADESIRSSYSQCESSVQGKFCWPRLFKAKRGVP